MVFSGVQIFPVSASLAGGDVARIFSSVIEPWPENRRGA